MLKYASILEIKNSEPDLYDLIYARRLEIPDCLRSKRRHGYWNNDTIFGESKKYKTISEMKKKIPGAIFAARRLKIYSKLSKSFGGGLLQ
jgi:hypothetical protein